MSKNALEKLVSEVGAYRLALMLGVKHPTIHTWLKFGRVPAERVLAVEAATGVSRYELRPDVYGPAPALPEDRAA
mgnify:CR=1 FL=1